MGLILLVIAGWLGCGLLSFGLVFGYFQKAYLTLAKRDSDSDFDDALIGFILGPVGLVTALIFIFGLSRHGYQGFKFNFWKD